MKQPVTPASRRGVRGRYSFATALVLAFLCVLPGAGRAQDWVKTGTSLGVEKVRLAVPDFKPSSNDPQNAALLKTFDDTLWNGAVPSVAGWQVGLAEALLYLRKRGISLAIVAQGEQAAIQAAWPKIFGRQ